MFFQPFVNTLSSPTGVAMGSDNNATLYCACNDTIYSISSSTGVISAFATQLPQWLCFNPSTPGVMLSSRLTRTVYRNSRFVTFLIWNVLRMVIFLILGSKSWYFMSTKLLSAWYSPSHWPGLLIFSFKESHTFAMLLLRVDPMNIVGVDSSASRSTSNDPLENWRSNTCQKQEDRANESRQ